MISWQTLNAVDTAVGRRPRPRSARWPASSSGSSTTCSRLPTGQTTRSYDRSSAVRAERRGRRAGRPGRADRPAVPDQPRTSSTPSTSRSSCSSATSCRVGSTSSTSRSNDGRRRPDVPRPVRRAVRRRPPDHAVRRPRADRRRLRRLARRARSPKATAQPRPARARAAGPAAGPTGGQPRTTLNVVAEQTSPSDADLTAPANSPFTDRVRQPGRVRPAQRRDPQGLADRRGGLQRRDLPRVRPRRSYDVPAARGRHLCLRLHRPPEHDRHARRSSKEPDGDDHADARRLRLSERPVRLADDDRPQEDRDPVPDQLVRLLLHRRAPGARRADRAGPARAPVRDRRRPTTSCSRCTRRS